MEKSKIIINAIKTYEKGYFGQGIGVACLDTGVIKHVELGTRIKGFQDMVHSKDFLYDDNGHGTHVAGIIGGKQTGVAPLCNIYMYKVLDEQGNGQMKDTIRALYDILENASDRKVRVLNISFGFLDTIQKEDGRIVLNLIQELWKEGICVVCASGNRGPAPSTVTFPGGHPLVVTVGCVDSFSGVGPTDQCIMKPEVIAPGKRIRSLGRSSNGYAIKSGTSMAAPMVSGALALALCRNPALTPKELKMALYQSCTPFQQKKNTGWGLLNVDKLLHLV